jgi:hypothetical protein
MSLEVESWEIPQRDRWRSVDRSSSLQGGSPSSDSFSGCAPGRRPTGVSPGPAFLNNFIAAPINAARAKVNTAEIIKVARELPPRAELPSPMGREKRGTSA